MTDNELIAEFMGYIYHEVADIDDSECGGLYTRKDVYSKIPILMDKYPEDDQFYLSDGWEVPNVDTYIEGPLKYDTSWDWLMPVVDKVCEYRLAYPNEANEVCNLKVVVMKEVLYKRVVNFIKWYNEQKLNPLTN
jgi:hypothetical protein